MGTQVDKRPAVYSGKALFQSGPTQQQSSLPPGNILNTPALAQRVQRFPTTLNSGEILYLQRAIGNRAVSNLLGCKTGDGEQSSPPIGAQGGEVDSATTQAIQGAKGGNAVIQRKLKFKSNDLDGKVSKRAKRAGKFGFESTFSKIQRTLQAYEAAGKDKQRQFALLTKLNALIEQWFQRSERKSNFGINDGIKQSSLHKLLQEIPVELAELKEDLHSMDFMKTYGTGSEKSARYHILSAQDDDMAVGKKVHQSEKHNTPLPNSNLTISNGMGGEKTTLVPPSEWGKLRDKYRNEKHLGLRPADRAAMKIYTDEQFAYLNPAMANDEDWFQSTMNKKLRDTDPHKNDKEWRKEAMEENRKVGAQLNKTLNKLPNWKQTQTIYRGESIPEAEAQAFQVGSVKTFPFFVSTSLKTATPLGMMKKFTSEARPWGVLYSIKSSKTGKDVAPWSQNWGEEEILFMSNTSFQVTKVLMRDDQKKRLDLEVIQV